MHEKNGHLIKKTPRVVGSIFHKNHQKNSWKTPGDMLFLWLIRADLKLNFFVKTKKSVEQVASKCNSHGSKCNHVTGAIGRWWMYMYTSRDKQKGMRGGETFKRGQECFKFVLFPELFPPTYRSLGLIEHIKHVMCLRVSHHQSLFFESKWSSIFTIPICVHVCIPGHDQYSPPHYSHLGGLDTLHLGVYVYGALGRVCEETRRVEASSLSLFRIDTFRSVFFLI